MQRICIVTGGSGYIGRFLIRELVRRDRFDLIYNLDLVDAGFDSPKVRFERTDVRQPIPVRFPALEPSSSWIINLAALCREPGSEPFEYFETNVKGAENTVALAESLGCRNLFFTSTMSTYGRAALPTPEDVLQCPETPYGISKLAAEHIHRTWQAKDPERRLIMCRPSVIFGPEDVGNILRMIKAVKRGYFFFPGDPGITKAYGYIHGLIDSFFFVMERDARGVVVFNYAENPLLDLRGMVKVIQARFRRPLFTARLPLGLLVAFSHLAQVAGRMVGKTFPIHPVRVRKVAFPTNIQPKYLMDNGFEFRFPFEKALDHWKAKSPDDF